MSDGHKMLCCFFVMLFIILNTCTTTDFFVFLTMIFGDLQKSEHASIIPRIASVSMQLEALQRTGLHNLWLT